LKAEVGDVGLVALAFHEHEEAVGQEVRGAMGREPAECLVECGTIMRV
jgi:hypothetical protein